MKNFIIGYGETLTSKVSIKNGSGDKSHPYSIEEAKARFISNLTNVVHDIEIKPDEQCANNEVVVKFTQHPTYLAKSYNPKLLFKKYGMRDVGSRAVKIKPDKWAVNKHPIEGLSSCIYVSGTKEQYKKMLESVIGAELKQTILEKIQTIESISMFSGFEKIKNIVNIVDKSGALKLEVVIHASEQDQLILESFITYLESLGGKADINKAKVVGGLTFISVYLRKGNEKNLADFSHLRVVRSMPKLRINNPDVIRNTLKTPFSLPEFEPINDKIKVCIFDGGIGHDHLLGEWVKEIIPNDVDKTHPSFVSHGSEVCSTYLFGPFDPNNKSMGKPYTYIDVIRVLSPDDIDPDLFDVLSRIEEVLLQKKYKYVNLSLGPRIPIDDDDVHVWTSVLDSLLQDGVCLATVAIGNDGDLKKEEARVQPPSDMVNCFAIGASDSNDISWKKASYSCIGPGRSPGLIKPDGLMFGGDANSLFYVYSPLTDSIVGTMGTSYAAPSALRVAAGIDAITDIELRPSTAKALMVHNAIKMGHETKNVGWGKMQNTPEEVIECLEDEATIVYQGELLQSQHLRIPIPLPNKVDCTWIHLKATFCINTITDPEHPLHYTRGGLDITFRKNESKFKADAEHPETQAFFSSSKLYPNEEDLRVDAHKWETCVSREQKFKHSTLVKPVFDVKFHAREQGANPTGNVQSIGYSLILSIRTEGDVNVYNSILQQNKTLQAVKVTNRVVV